MSIKGITITSYRNGETKLMNCGMSATIIAYRKAIDIDVRFEDGTIVTNRTYDEFKRGKILNPNMIIDYSNRIGETKMMHCGMNATIIIYRNCNNIDIQFEDGIIVTNRTYREFIAGVIANPHLCVDYLTRIGETKLMNCGMNATIIAYRNSHDIDIKFEDGEVVTNRHYTDFVKGKIANPKHPLMNGTSYNELLCLFYLKDAGFKKAERGSIPELKGLELDLYANINGVKIGIEYDGGRIRKGNKGHTIENDIKKNKYCKDAGIILYRIREPQLPILDSTSFDFQLTSNQHASINLQQTLIKLIHCINKDFGMNICDDIDFKRDDAKIKDFMKLYCKSLATTRIGEMKLMNCNMIASIIVYRSATDIDVKFEDTTIVTNVTYGDFVKGKIFNPNIYISKYLYETKTMNCGLTATIIAYRKSSDIDIQFENGIIVTNKTYQNFKRGQIKCP